MKDKKSQYWIYGQRSCNAAIRNPNRFIKKILITHQNLSSIPKELLNKTEIVEAAKINRIIEINNAVVQGIAVLTKHLKQPNLKEFLHLTKDEQQLVILLDHVLDPQNIGSIFRSAAAFGAKTIISTFDNCPTETASLIKASVGTFELIPFIHVVNLVQAINLLKEHDYWVIGLDGQAKQSIQNINSSSYKRIALILGSEGKGLRLLTRKNCDLILKITMQQNVESLNVSCAAAIALYQLNKIS